MADVERAIAKDVMAASLRILVLAGSAVILASCYAVTETDVPHGVGRDLVGHPVAVVPAGKNRSDPAVVTSRGVLAYDRDLRACKQSALASVGPDRSADDAAAILRTIRDKPLGGSVAVRYESDDVATQRDAVVKRCLSRRGYLVEN